MFINVKAVKTFLKEYDKQISQEAIEALNVKVMHILDGAIINTRHFKRITETEINFTKS